MSFKDWYLSPVIRFNKKKKKKKKKKSENEKPGGTMRCVQKYKFALDPCSCWRMPLGTGIQGKIFTIILHFWTQPWPGCVQKYKTIAHDLACISVDNEHRLQQEVSETRRLRMFCTSERRPGFKFVQRNAYKEMRSDLVLCSAVLVLQTETKSTTLDPSDLRDYTRK